MRNFLFQVEKKELEENVEIEIFEVNEKNEIILEKKHYSYTLYIKKADFERLNLKNDKILVSEKDFFDKNGEKISKLEVKSKEIYEYFHLKHKEKEITLYEADIDLKTEYLIENRVKISENDNPRTLEYVAIDIETIGEINNQEIIMISKYSKTRKNSNKVFVNGEKLPKEIIEGIKNIKGLEYEIKLLPNEKELLTAFRDEIISEKYPIILGWNVIDFDFAVIRDRMKKLGIEFKFSEFEGETKLRINKDFFKDSTLTCPGVLFMDGIQLLRMNFLSFEDNKLDTVAKEVLGDEKIDIETEEEQLENKIKAIENMLKKDPIKLIEYNFKDSKLTYQIIEKLNLIELMMLRSTITGNPISRVKSPIASLDIMYLKKLHEKGLIAPTNHNFEDSTQMEGAFVIEPEKGFYENVFVFDFKSLYPSIIMTFNIDPFSYNKEGEITAPNGARFTKEPAILPELIHKLYKERDKAKKEKNKIKSNALKITMNSFYGAVGSPKSRFYNKEVGEAITSFGRHLIQKTKQYLEENNFGKVIYGDTDSLFLYPTLTNINNAKTTLTEKEAFGRKIEAQITSFFQEYVQKNYKQQSFLEIQFEKLYSKFFIASKKRYVGFDEITKKLIFVGLEAIRGDWTDLAKKFQTKLIEQIFANNQKEDIEKFIKKYIEDLKQGKYDTELVYKKKTTKPLSEYTKTTPPHVKAAREIKNFEGQLVKYVMLKSGPKHISLIGPKPEYDYSHYIEVQLKGVSDDILTCFGIDFDKINDTKKQSSLGRFF